MSITTGTNKTTYSRHLHRHGTEQNDYAVILSTDRNEWRLIYMHQMSLTANTIAAKLFRHYARTGTKTVTDNNSSFDSDGDHPLSLSKVSHHNRLRSFSGLPSRTIRLNENIVPTGSKPFIVKSEWFSLVVPLKGWKTVAKTPREREYREVLYNLYCSQNMRNEN